MHPALLVSELLNLVFEILQDLDFRTLAPTSSTSLSRCARTCRAWYEPAVRRIWQTLDSILPLLKLFPSETFDIGSRSNPGLWRFKRALRPKDWDAFARYAPLVRHLSFREGKDVVPYAIIALSVQKPSKYRTEPFLPNLLSLRWTAITGNALSLCLVLASPSLRKVTLCSVGNEKQDRERDDSARGLLYTLADVCPLLTEVHLNITTLWSVGDIVNPLRQFEYMETLALDVGPLGPWIVVGLRLHATLRVLHLDLRGDIDERSLRELYTYRNQGTFPALQELTLTGEAHVIRDTLPLIIPARLQRVNISTFTLLKPEDLSLCLHHFSTHCAGMIEVRIATLFDGNQTSHVQKMINSGDRYLLAISHLLPLTALKHLEHLSIELGYPVLVDDADVALLLTQWPNIQGLAICPAPEWVPLMWRTKVTLRVLDWISTNVKGLRYLGLPIDATTFASPVPINLQNDLRMDLVVQEQILSPPTPPLTPEPSVVGKAAIAPVPQVQLSQLETLFVGVSLIERGAAYNVAHILRGLFPSLRTVRPSEQPARGREPRRGEAIAAEWNMVARKLMVDATSITNRTRKRGSIEEMDTGMDMEVCEPAAVADGMDEEEWAMALVTFQ